MLTKENLTELMNHVNDMKQILKGQGDDDKSTDLMKSVTILENKIRYYSSNFDALNSLKKINSGEAEK